MSASSNASALPAAPNSAAAAARFVATALLWGASSLFIKVAVEGLSPSQVALASLLFGAIALVIVMLVTRRTWPREAKYWMHMSVVGVLLGVLVLQETLSWNEPVGAAVVILGILIGPGALRLPARRRVRVRRAPACRDSVARDDDAVVDRLE